MPKWMGFIDLKKNRIYGHPLAKCTIAVKCDDSVNFHNRPIKKMMNLLLLYSLRKNSEKALAQLISFARHGHQSSKHHEIYFPNFQTMLARHGEFDIFVDRHTDHGSLLLSQSQSMII